MELRQAKVPWRFGQALQFLLELYVLCGYFVPVFHQFVSCSVFRLSFNSFCYPSVDSGRVASLPGLGLIVFVGNWVQGDWRVFETELTELTKWGSGGEVGLGQAEVLWLFGHELQFLLELCVLRRYFVPVFHQFCFLFGVSPVV
jgi:hypothetical protein